VGLAQRRRSSSRIVRTIQSQDLSRKVSEGKATLTFPKSQIVFSQGDAAHAVFYIYEGRIRLSTVSQEGKEAAIEILDRGNFLGEGCLAGQLGHMTTATSLETSTLVRIDKQAMNDALRYEPAFSKQFHAYLLARNIRIQEDLVDHSLTPARSGWRESYC
jgi:CRP/FNR family transcriptional regulator, cyclic AMP receptor protein